MTQTDIPPPAGSVWFGMQVAVLPNGNMVVSDPRALSNVGAVYLYNPDGELLSTLTGATPGDGIGYRIVVLPDGDFLVASASWINPDTGATNAGAVTRVDGDTGMNGVVTAANSLVGSTERDFIGINVQVLPDGGWVVQGLNWDNGPVEDAGAITVVPAGSNVTGPISGFNSLVGTTAGDRVGNDGFVVLANGNLVLCSASWDNGALQDVGAATWVDTSVGISGPISATNSLIGSSPSDIVGSGGCATALVNGDYVVKSPYWDRAGVVDAGAATWADGDTGRVGELSEANSLFGTQEGDRVGGLVQALANGHYVVSSPRWDNGDVVDVGAVTWANGEGGLVGPVTAANSLTGSQAGDMVGATGVTPLTNGNYVATSYTWANGSAAQAGAATWRDGNGPHAGVVSAANSLVGSSAQDRVALRTLALPNGHYVVQSERWDGGTGADGVDRGAATWGNGEVGSFGIVSAANSLVGSTAGDQVGNAVVALPDGDYVVLSRSWDNGSTVDAGAATWVDGDTGLSGAVSPANSMVGASTGDELGRARALPNGRLLLTVPFWNGPGSKLGAATVIEPGPDMAGTTVTSANAVHGTRNNDYVGLIISEVLPDGRAVILSRYWDNGTVEDAGAVTVLAADGSTTGPVDESNSVLGTETLGGEHIVMDYDPVRERLLVGLPLESRVTLLAALSDEVFADGFEN